MGAAAPTPVLRLVGDLERLTATDREKAHTDLSFCGNTNPYPNIAQELKRGSSSFQGPLLKAPTTRIWLAQSFERRML